MEILPEIKTASLALYLENSKELIISDLHFGYEESMNIGGVMLPRSFYQEMYNNTKSILESYDCNSIILNGDVKHDFGKILKTEWSHTLKYLELFKGKNITLIKGNHDVMMQYIAKKADVKMVDYYLTGNILIIHGDKLQDIKKIEKQNFAKIRTIIIGHDHPAVTLNSNSRKETFKCFLSGKTKDKKRSLLVMPSFNSVTIGTNVLESNMLSPYLQHDLSSFKVIVVADKEYDFGTVKQLRKQFS